MHYAAIVLVCVLYYDAFPPSIFDFRSRSFALITRNSIKIQWKVLPKLFELTAHFSY